jgi:hypothetical protein
VHKAPGLFAVVARPEFLLDQCREAGRGRQVGPAAVGLRPLQQQSLAAGRLLIEAQREMTVYTLLAKDEIVRVFT